MVSIGQVSSDSSLVETIFHQYKNSIEEIQNNAIWQGSSRDNAYNKANEFINSYQNAISQQFSHLISALNLLIQYKEIKREKEQLEAKLSTAEENEVNAINNKINSLNLELTNLKTKIENELTSIMSLTTKEASSKNTSLSIDVGELLTKVNSSTTHKLADGDSLANYYEKGYIENLMQEIKNGKGSGREKAVNSALTLIKLAADKNVRLDYTYGASHGNPTTSNILNASDCSSFVSYLLNQGSGSNSYDMTTGTIANKFKKCEYKDAKPGDVINSSSANYNHVEFIVENHPEEGYFITAEAKKSSYGVTLSKTTYDEVRKYNQYAYNLDNVYK